MDSLDLERFLNLLEQWDGSDLHLKAGAPPRVRIDGELRLITDEPSIDPDSMAAVATSIMPPRVSETFAKHPEVDFAYSIKGLGRFRVNAFYQRSTVAMVFRRVRSAAGPRTSSQP